MSVSLAKICNARPACACVLAYAHTYQYAIRYRPARTAHSHRTPPEPDASGYHPATGHIPGHTMRSKDRLSELLREEVPLEPPPADPVVEAMFLKVDRMRACIHALNANTQVVCRLDVPDPTFHTYRQTQDQLVSRVTQSHAAATKVCDALRELQPRASGPLVGARARMARVQYDYMCRLYADALQEHCTALRMRHCQLQNMLQLRLSHERFRTYTDEDDNLMIKTDDIPKTPKTRFLLQQILNEIEWLRVSISEVSDFFEQLAHLDSIQQEQNETEEHYEQRGIELEELCDELLEVIPRRRRAYQAAGATQAEVLLEPPPTDPDVEAIFQEVDRMRGWIDELNANTQLLSSLPLPTFHTYRQIQDQLDSLVTQSLAVATKVFGALREFQPRASGHLIDARARMARVQYARMCRLSADALQAHLSTLRALLDNRLHLLREQIKLINPTISDEECQTLLDTKNINSLFVDNLKAETPGARRALPEARVALLQVKARYEELTRLKVSIREMWDLFQQLAHLYSIKQEQIETVEHYALRTTERVELWGRDLLRGKKKLDLIICLASGFVIVLVVVIIVVAAKK